mmetsp:Transcript_33406/g.105277  ORF Transcript_33406/g.105277 Transcript_33406/m.105277 type:complete len:223 (+) Transcript_33406:761-1429(+)
MNNKLVEQRPLHHRCRSSLPVDESKHSTSGIVGTQARVDRVSDTSHVRRLCEIVSPSSSPHKHEVGKMPHDRMGFLLGGCKHLADGGDVLVVPCVAVCQGRSLADASDLITVVPPCHHSCLLGGLISQPVVCLQVVVDHHNLPVVRVGLEDDGGVGHAVSELMAVAFELERVGSQVVDEEDGEDDTGNLGREALVEDRRQALPHAVHLVELLLSRFAEPGGA